MNTETREAPNHNTSDMEIPVYLICQDLLIHKMAGVLAEVGLELFESYCIPDLSHVVLLHCGFKDRSDALGDLYFNLIREHCHAVSQQNRMPAKEAQLIYDILRARVRPVLTNNSNEI